jgi:hypothetical protein
MQIREERSSKATQKFAGDFPGQFEHHVIVVQNGGQKHQEFQGTKRASPGAYENT